ncbi:hypothetical protein DOY81_003620 [Sarcophaga bullata]|nr:hypothetical protein DOY81_003620 [Sarcophaga bullata]
MPFNLVTKTAILTQIVSFILCSAKYFASLLRKLNLLNNHYEIKKSG